MLLIYKWKLQWLPSAKDNVHVFIYTKSKKTPNVFIYKNPDNLKKARQFPLRIYIHNARHLRLRDFLWKFWSWHLYTKSMTLCVTWRFYIEKPWYFAKSKIICVTFLYKKIRTLYVTQFFVEFLKLAEEGGNFYLPKKQCNLRYIFTCKKQCTLR